MYFRRTILIDKAFLYKSEDSFTEWTAKDSSGPMLLEGCPTTEARLLGVKSHKQLITDLELEHSSIFLGGLDHDTLYIFGDATYRWLWSTDRSV